MNKQKELENEIEELEFKLEHSGRVESAWSIEEIEKQLIPIKLELKGLKEGRQIEKDEIKKKIGEKMELIREYIRKDNHPTLRGDELNLILHHLRELQNSLGEK